MRKIPTNIRNQIDADPYYKKCCRHKEGGCDGRITIEHAIIFAGRQTDFLWSLLPLCTYHHSVDLHQDGDGLDKEINEWIALNRAPLKDLLLISKAIDYVHKRNYLNKKYGEYRA